MSCDKANLVDCNYGRQIGCQTYCCKLIVRLSESEAKEIYPDNPNKFSLDKDADGGYCEFLDTQSYQCSIFEKHPEICRGFTCNGDKMLQVDIKEEDDSIVDLSRKTTEEFIPQETYREIPVIK